MDLVVYDTPEQVAEGAARRIAESIASATEHFTLGLAGGSTPIATYEALRDQQVDWDKVDAWVSDERWVPQDHERCNGRMADEILLSLVPARFIRPRWSEFLEPADSAAHYEAAIRSLHDGKRPDLILLGLGEDGHTASLFPGSKALDEDERWYVANVIPETGESRLTATYPLLWKARLVMMITAGERKAPALRDSFAGNTPAGRVGDGEAGVEWHVDRAAASLLS